SGTDVGLTVFLLFASDPAQQQQQQQQAGDSALPRVEGRAGALVPGVSLRVSVEPGADGLDGDRRVSSVRVAAGWRREWVRRVAWQSNWTQEPTSAAAALAAQRQRRWPDMSGTLALIAFRLCPSMVGALFVAGCASPSDTGSRKLED